MQQSRREFEGVLQGDFGKDSYEPAAISFPIAIMEQFKKLPR
jgi:hypothetical protein